MQPRSQYLIQILQYVITTCHLFGTALTFSANGTQSTTLISNTTGCDSIVTLNLSVNPTSSIIEEALRSANQNCPYLWNGITFTEFRLVRLASLSATNGCDSIVVPVNLTVISEFTGLETHTRSVSEYGYSFYVICEHTLLMMPIGMVLHLILQRFKVLFYRALQAVVILLQL